MRRTQFVFASTIAGGALAACAPRPCCVMPSDELAAIDAAHPSSGAPEGQADYPSRCTLNENLVPILVVAPEIVRPGTEITLHPYQAAPYAREELPLDCISSWHTDPEGAIASDIDAQGRARIAGDLPAGATIVISYRIGDQVARKELTLAGRDEVVLTGTRSETKRNNCVASQPVGEIVFGADGTFSVTYRPFESYRDYWGTYRFEPSSGALIMETTGGNAIPQGLDLAGTARLEADGGLTLRNIWLGDPEGLAPPPRVAIENCEYRFK